MITKIRLFAVLVALGIFLGIPASASALPYMTKKNTEPGPTPYEQTYYIHPDGSYEIRWDVGYNSSIDFVTQCSGGPEQPGCSWSTTYTEYGEYCVKAQYWVSGQQVGEDLGCTIVQHPRDMEETPVFRIPAEIQTPETVEICSSRDHLRVDWFSSKEIDGSKQGGGATVFRPRTKTTGKWCYQVELFAPKGRLELLIELWNDPVGGSPAAHDRYTKYTRVTAANIPTYAGFISKFYPVQRPHFWHASTDLSYLALKESVWKIALAAQVKRAGRWRTLKRRVKSDTTEPGSARYSVNRRGRAAVVIRGRKWRKWMNSACRRRARLKATYLVTTPQDKRVYRKTRTKRARVTGCSRPRAPSPRSGT